MTSDLNGDSVRANKLNSLGAISLGSSPLMCSLCELNIATSPEIVHRQTEREPAQTQEYSSESHINGEIKPSTCTADPKPVKNPVMSWGYIRQTAQHVKKSLRLFAEQVKRMTAKQIILTLFFIILLMSGNVMQILMLNFWLVSFPSDGAPGNYTAFAIPGIIYSVFFLILLAVYVVIKRPNLRFTRHSYGWKIIILIGFYDTFNSWLSTYAATQTSEMLQSLFTNLSPLYSIAFSKWILHDPRRYLNIWIIVTVVLTIVGILIVLCFNLTEGSGATGSKKWFVLIFFSSIPFRVLMNIYQSLYMIVYTNDATFMKWLYYRFNGKGEGKGEDGTNGEEGAAQPSKTIVDTATPGGGGRGDNGRVFRPDDAANGAHLMIPCRGSSSTTPIQHEVVSTLYHQGDDTAVKLVMLAGETFVQMCFTLAFLPADAIPWFGGSATVQDTWTNFRGGIRSFFTICKNFIYGFLYALGFVFNYIGAAYVNHRSVTLCSLITQLSSPLTGLLLVIAPSLNALGAEDASWGRDVVAIIMLTLAALIYVVWEELTHEEMEEGERELKLRKLRVCPIEKSDVLLCEGVAD